MACALTSRITPTRDVFINKLAERIIFFEIFYVFLTFILIYQIDNMEFSSKMKLKSCVEVNQMKYQINACFNLVQKNCGSRKRNFETN